jgi:hypothetical protein
VNYLSKKEYTTDKFIMQGDNGYLNAIQIIKQELKFSVMVQRAILVTAKQ